MKKLQSGLSGGGQIHEKPFNMLDMVTTLHFVTKVTDRAAEVQLLHHFDEIQWCLEVGGVHNPGKCPKPPKIHHICPQTIVQ